MKENKHMSNFKEFLEEQKKTTPSKQIENRKDLWLNSIKEIYKEIEQWIGSFKKEGLLDIKEAPISINEDLIGQYETSKLLIVISGKLIEIEPIGTYILGSYGRIDIKGTKGHYMLVQPELGKWVFVKRRSLDMTRLDFTSDNFFNVIKNVL